MADTAISLEKIRDATASLYKHGRIDNKGVAKAVDAKLVNANDYKEITGDEYTEVVEE